jgi:hypothetical protein
MAPSPEAHGGEDEGSVTGDDPSVGVEPLSRLSGLIARALESADQLAVSTRRTRRGTRVAPGEPGSTDNTGP